eukprot:g30550.t1
MMEYPEDAAGTRPPFQDKITMLGHWNTELEGTARENCHTSVRPPLLDETHRNTLKMKKTSTQGRVLHIGTRLSRQLITTLYQDRRFSSFRRLDPATNLEPWTS